MSENLILKAINDLRVYTFEIPYQQRGYRWTKENINLLLKDLRDYITNGKEKFYCLQPISVIERSENVYAVLDGQQRLTTLYLIWKYLVSDGKLLSDEEEIFHFKFDKDKDDERKNLLKNPITKTKDTKIDYYYITEAYKAIKDWFEENKWKQQFKDLFEASADSEKSVQVIWYLITDSTKEHEVFRNINSGKIQLSNSDLIKALLLNRKNGISNQEQIAAQFELMERKFAEDRFWYMISSSEINSLKGQSRLDLLFNLVAEVKNEEYQNEPRSSFFKFADFNNQELIDMWKNVRQKFQRIRDIFDDVECFHYVGFITYCRKECSLQDILSERERHNKAEFIEYLKKEIKGYLGNNQIEDYSYIDSSTESLRMLFILHNIETIIFRYKQLQETMNLRFSYEYFPFELLNKQKWHIEHIDSQTENELKKKEDREDWIKSALSDYKTELSEFSYDSNDLENTKKFTTLYSSIMKKISNDNPIKNKDGVGNLVLLDSHTNTSFHNSLFPKKRRIVIIASGLRAKKDKESDVQSVYVPICTQQVYTKSYTKSSDAKLNAWTQDDYVEYVNDMKEKLSFYFNDEGGK